MISILIALTECPYPEIAALATAMLHGEDCWYALFDALIERGINP